MGSKLHSGLICRFSANGKYTGEAGKFPPTYSANSQEQIQRLKHKSVFVYTSLRALTDFIIFPTAQLCKFPISKNHSVGLIIGYSAYAKFPHTENTTQGCGLSGTKLQETRLRGPRPPHCLELEPHFISTRKKFSRFNYWGFCIVLSIIIL